MRPPLSTLLLDLDGVIRHFDPEHVAAVEVKHRLRAGGLVEAAFEPALLHSLVTGHTSRAQWCKEVGRRVGNIEAPSEWLADRGSVDQTMLVDVDALRARGVVVAVLTNGTDTIAREMDQLGLAVRFDAIFNSADIGFAKPDRRAFEYVCRELGIEPSTVFFSDDTRSNLRGAIEIGMTARLFEGVEVFRRHLVETGLVLHLGPVSSRINHRGWIVLESIASDDGVLCVDFFEDPAGGFGFEHLRAEPEDGGRWTAVGGFGASRYESGLIAADAARDAVSWLGREDRARESWAAWQATFRSP